MPAGVPSPPPSDLWSSKAEVCLAASAKWGGGRAEPVECPSARRDLERLHTHVECWVRQTHSRRSFTAVATVGFLFLSGWAETGSPDTAKSATTAASSLPIASSDPTSIAPPPTSGGKALSVTLSSGTAAPKQPADVLVKAPDDLGSQAAYLVIPAPDGSMDIVSLPVAFDKDLKAEMTVSLDSTTTLRAIVPVEVSIDAAKLQANTPLLAQSSDFRVTVS